MEWFRINASFPQHPKHGRLARALGITREQAGWMVLRLFCWVAQTCDGGNLEGVDAEDLADGCGWNGDAQALLRALLACKWIDQDPLRVHEWREYQAPVFANRDRVKSWRERQKAVTVACHYSNDSVMRTVQTVQTDKKEKEEAVGPELLRSPNPATPSQDFSGPTFPTVGKVSAWQATRAQAEKWARLFPDLDLGAELERMLAWLEANPQRRKTSRGMPAAVLAWLGRSQNNPRLRACQTAGGRSQGKAEALRGRIARFEGAGRQDLADQLKRELAQLGGADG